MQKHLLQSCAEQVSDIYGTPHVLLHPQQILKQYQNKYLKDNLKKYKKVALNKSVTYMARTTRAPRSPTNHHFKHLLHKLHFTHCELIAQILQKVHKMNLSIFCTNCTKSAQVEQKPMCTYWIVLYIMLDQNYAPNWQGKTFLFV